MKNELQTFIDLVIYHAQCLQHLAPGCAPLADRLSQNEFEWSPLHEEAFPQVKHLAQNITRLPPIDYQSHHTIYLFTDISKDGVDGWIGQGPSSQKAYPAAFHSRKFAISQLQYPVHELELLAIVDAVQSFHPMLYGIRFTVVTDNKGLLLFVSQTNLPCRQRRWRIFFQSYDFNIIHGPGKDNLLADTLPRIYEKREASADMILVDPTEKKAIEEPIPPSQAASNKTSTSLTLWILSRNLLSSPQHLLTSFLYPNIYQGGKLKMSPSQTRATRRKKVTTQGLWNKDFITWQPPLRKVSTPCRATKPAPKNNPMTLPKPGFSFKQLNHSLLHFCPEFKALQTKWHTLHALTLSPTALEEFMPLLPNWTPLPSPARDMQLPHLLPLPLLLEISWNNFLCLQNIEPNTGNSVYGTNVNPILQAKTATTTPRDLATSLSLVPFIPPEVALLLTTQCEGMRIDGLSLLCSPMMMDIQFSIL